MVHLPENYSLSLKRHTDQWGNEFIEHWTLQCRGGEFTFKQRVVGPNGEACRHEGIPVDEVDDEIRDGFNRMLKKAGGVL